MWRTATSIGLLVLLGGCAASSLRPEIPLGTWNGTGSVVLERWSEDKAASTQPAFETIFRDYPTYLRIAERACGGERLIELDIRSQRGNMADLEGAETHIVAVLGEYKRVGDRAVLYRLRDWSYNPSEKRASKPPPADGPIAASCISEKGAVVLRVHYMQDFWDVLVFEGDRVRKIGAVFNHEQDGGLIHWSEELTRSRSETEPTSPARGEEQ